MRNALLVSLTACLLPFLAAAPRSKSEVTPGDIPEEAVDARVPPAVDRASDGVRLYRVLGKPATRNALEFSSDGKRLLASENGEDEDNVAIVEWDVAGKALIRRFDSDLSSNVYFLRFSPSGKRLMVGSMFGNINVWDEKRRKRYSFASSKTIGTFLKLATITSDNPPIVTTIIRTGMVQQRKIETGETDIYSDCSRDNFITSAAATRDGKAFVVASGASIDVFPKGDFNSATDLKKACETFSKPHFTDIAISEDGSTVLAHEHRSEIQALFDVKSDRLIKKWKGHVCDVCAIVPFNRQNRFAAGDGKGVIKIWDAKGNLLVTLEDKNHEEPITALAITRDDRFLASVGEGRPIEVWELGPNLAPALPPRN